MEPIDNISGHIYIESEYILTISQYIQIRSHYIIDIYFLLSP